MLGLLFLKRLFFFLGGGKQKHLEFFWQELLKRQRERKET